MNGQSLDRGIYLESSSIPKEELTTTVDDLIEVLNGIEDKDKVRGKREFENLIQDNQFSKDINIFLYKNLMFLSSNGLTIHLFLYPQDLLNRLKVFREFGITSLEDLAKLQNVIIETESEILKEKLDKMYKHGINSKDYFLILLINSSNF